MLSKISMKMTTVMSLTNELDENLFLIMSTIFQSYQDVFLSSCLKAVLCRGQSVLLEAS